MVHTSHTDDNLSCLARKQGVRSMACLWRYCQQQASKPGTGQATKDNVVLKQASRGRCVNNQGDILAATSQWIVKQLWSLL